MDQVAEAEAEANRVLSESLTAQIIEYNKIQKWNGVMPKVTGKDGGLLIDVDIDEPSSGTAAQTPNG